MSRTRRIAIIALFIAFLTTFGLSAFTFSGKVANADHDHSGDIALTSSYLSEIGTETDSDGTTYYNLSTGNYYLSGNISVRYTIRIQDGASVSLCLNGYTLSFAGSSSYRYPVFEVLGSETSGNTVTVTKSSFTVTDCSSSGKGTISGNYVSGSVIKAYLADVTIEGGNITGGRGTVVYDPYNNNAKLDATQDAAASGYDDAASLITAYGNDGNDGAAYTGYAYGDESFYLQGGGIYALDSNLTITGGVVYGNGAASATALYNGETVKQYLRMQYSTSSKGNVLNWGGDGYRVTSADAGVSDYLSSLTLNTDYYAEDDTGYIYRTFTKGDTVTFARAQGGGIFIGTSYEWSGADDGAMTYRSTFVMSGGSISNNVSYMHGGGMFVHNVDYTMKGGVIGGSTNYLAKYTADGANIEMENGGNYAVAGLDSFSNSSCSGGGVYVYRGVGRGYGNDIKITGTAELSYNYSAGSNAALTVTEGSTLAISGSVTISYNHGAGTIVAVSSADTSIEGLIYEYNYSSGSANFTVTISNTLDDENSFLYGAYGVSIKNSYFRYNQSGTLGSSTSDGSDNGTSGGGPLSVSVGEGMSNYVTLSGVTVTENTFTGSSCVSLAGGIQTITNCTFTNNEATGYYVKLELKASSYSALNISRPMGLTFSNCTVTGNTSTGGAGAVYVNGANAENVTYTISNVVISDNVVTGRYNSSGTYVVGTGGALTIGAGTVSSTYPSVYGVANSAFVLSNVTISNNENYGGYGGMTVTSTYYGTTLTMIDCTFTGNTATGNGGGLYLGYGVTATMTDCTVSGNSAGLMGELNSDGDAVETAGTSGNGGGIYLAGAGQGNATYAGKSGAILAGYGLIVSGNTATNMGGGIYVGTGALVTNSTYVSTLGTAFDGASVTLAKSEKANSSITGNTVTGYYSSATAANLSNGYGGGVYVTGTYDTTKSLTVDGTATAYNIYKGYVGTFTMTNGSISGNTSLNSGGGIYSSGTVSLTNVNVDNNAATGMYEDYYFLSTSSNYGKGFGAQGGGIYVTTTNNGYNATSQSAYASLTISGGSVSGNTANSHGAGLSLNGYGLTVSISDCTISGNVSSGGYVNSTTTARATATTYGDGYFDSYNCSYAYGLGGGLYVSGVRSVTISNSEISYNSAASGGGIYIDNSSTFNAGDTTGNSELSGDSSTYSWSAGVYSLTMTVTDTDITNNEATGYASTTYTIGGTTYNSVTAGNGGGIYLNGYAYQFTMTGGSLSNNSANNGGGLYQTARYSSAYTTTDAENATLCGVTVSGNEATAYESTSISKNVITTSTAGGNGGGVYIANTAALTELKLTSNGDTATTVSGNMAENAGGGIYIGNNSATNYASVTLGSAQVTDNYTKCVAYTKTVTTYTAAGTSNSVDTATSITANGAGVYVAGAYAQLIVSGTAQVSGNIKFSTTSTEYDTKTASNVHLQGTTAYLQVGDLSEGASIYITSSSPANNRYIAVAYDGATLADEAVYIKSDSGTYTISTTAVGDVVYIILSTSATSDGGSTDGSLPESAGAGENTSAFTLTVTISVTGDATMTGDVSGYYAAASSLEGTSAVYTIIINDGYYFGSVVIDGVTYYYSSNGQLTSSGTAVKGVLSATPTITNNGSYLTLTIIYTDDLSSAISDGELAFGVSLVTKSTSGGFTVSTVDDTTPVTTSEGYYTAAYDGNTVIVAVTTSGGSSASASNGSLLSTFVSTSGSSAISTGYTVYYLVGGAWVTTAPTEAGTYSVRIGWTQTGYVGGSYYGTWTLVITAQEWTNDSHDDVSATLAYTSIDYAAGTSFTPSVTVTNTALSTELTLDTDYVITYSGNVNAGTGTVTITGIGNYTGSFTVSFTINKVDSLSMTISNETYSTTYDATSHSVELGTASALNSFSGNVLYTIVRADGADASSYETVSATATFGTYTFSFTNAGTYTVTVYSEGDSNYNSNSFTFTVTVAKGAVEIDVSGVSTSELTYNGNTQTFDVSGATTTYGSTITYALTAASGASLSGTTLYALYAGEYTVTYSVAESDNYAGATATVTFTINRMTLSIPSYTGSNSFVYDGELHTLTLETTSSAYTVDYNAQTNVGTYTVTISLADPDNTQWTGGDTGSKTYTYTITQATNTISTTGDSAYTYTYTGSAQGASGITITSLYDSSNITYWLTSANTITTGSFENGVLSFTVTDAGTYTYTFTSQGGSNYVSDTLTVTIVVNPAVNTLTAASGSLSYTGTYTGAEQTLSLGTLTAALGGTVSYTVTGTDGTSTGSITSGEEYTFTFTNAGTYTVAFASAESDNYSSESVTFTVTVAKAANSISASGVTTAFEYNGAAQSASVGSVTAAFGEVSVSVSNGATYADGIVSFTDAGTYTVVFTAAGTENYEGATATVNIVVSPYAVTVPVVSQSSYTYTGSELSLVFVADSDSAYYTITNGTQTNAGIYTVSARLTDTNKYTWADGSTAVKSYSFTIGKATPDYTLPTGLSATAGAYLLSITLPDGWAWADSTQKVTASQTTYAAVYTPDDTDNYNTVSEYVSVSVSAATVSTGTSSTVAAEISSDSGLSDGTTLTVTEMSVAESGSSESDIVEAVTSAVSDVDKAEVVAVYDISLSSEFSGTITVTVAIPSSLSGSDFYIVHIHDGNIVEVYTSDSYTVSGGYVTFETDSLSPFAFCVSTSSDASLASVITFAVIDVLLIGVIAATYVYGSRKKRNAQ